MNQLVPIFYGVANLPIAVSENVLEHGIDIHGVGCEIPIPHTGAACRRSHVVALLAVAERLGYFPSLADHGPEQEPGQDHHRHEGLEQKQALEWRLAREGTESAERVDSRMECGQR